MNMYVMRFGLVEGILNVCYCEFLKVNIFDKYLNLILC